MNIFGRMELLRSGFTAAEEKIYQKLKTDPQLFIGGCTISDYAQLCGVSKSAVSRFSVKLGYQAFSQLRYEVANSLLSQVSDNIAGSSYNHIVTIYRDVLDLMNNESCRIIVDNVARLIVIKRRVKIFGFESSGLLGEIFMNRLLKTGIDASCYKENFTITTAASFTEHNDVAFFISTRMNSESMQAAITSAHENGSAVVVLTSNPDSKPRSAIDQLIVLPATRGAGKSFYLQEHPVYLVFLEALTERISELNISK